MKSSCTPNEPQQETDLWWGSYSGWTMLPSFALSLVWAGLRISLAWWLVPAGWVRGTITLSLLVIWGVQLGRWSYRIFGYNYRLTTHWVYRARGFRRSQASRMALAEIGSVQVMLAWPQRTLGIGQIVLRADTGAREPFVLDGRRDHRNV